MMAESAEVPADSTPATPAVPEPDSGTLAALRGVLADANFTPAGLRGHWGTRIEAALERNNAAPDRWFTRGANSGLPVLARLFVLDAGVDWAAAEATFGADLLRDLGGAGLLVEGPDGIHATLDLKPYAVPVGVPRYFPDGRPAGDVLYLFSDHGTLTRGEVAGDFVLGLGGAGRTLVEITPRRPVELAADIGCGCGIQALLLARHARRVVATDVSERALAMTRLGAGLAGLDNVQTRLGSLFEPLDEPVDLLVSNPPFVITPQGHTQTLEYRDGGRPGDELMRAVLSGAPEHLRPGGQAAFLGNWESDPLAWITADDTDVMIIERERLDAVAYAETWIRDGGVPRASRRWNADTAAWLEDFRARTVSEVAFGWVRMQRAEDAEPSGSAESAESGETVGAGEPLRHLEVISGTLGANNAGLALHLDTRLAMLQWLAGVDFAELVGTKFLRASDVTEHRHFTPGAEEPTMITLEQGTGFARTFDTDTALAGFVGVADGTLTLGQVGAALAQLLGVDAAALTAQLAEQLHTLIPAGIVYPAGE